MFGTDEARKVWKERVKNLKNLYHETIIRGYKENVGKCPYLTIEIVVKHQNFSQKSKISVKNSKLLPKIWSKI